MTSIINKKLLIALSAIAIITIVTVTLVLVLKPLNPQDLNNKQYELELVSQKNLENKLSLIN